jgi:hypothetical protein
MMSTAKLQVISLLVTQQVLVDEDAAKIAGVICACALR